MTVPTTNRDFEWIATQLWDLLDDIDTISDMVKGDDKAYRKGVERIQRERFKYADSNGYVLAWKDVQP